MKKMSFGLTGTGFVDITITDITDKWITCLGEMSPYLMGTTSFESYTDQAATCMDPDWLVVGNCPFPTSFHGDSPVITPTARQERVKGSTLPDFPRDDCQVIFFDLPVAEHLCQALVRPLVDGKKDEAGCVAVETLHHTDIRPNTFGSVLLKVLKNNMVEGPFETGRGRLSFRTGRLVDDEQIVIPVDDILLTEGVRLVLASIQEHFDGLTGADRKIAPANPFPIDKHTAEIDDLPGQATRNVCNRFRKNLVHPLTVVTIFHNHLEDLCSGSLHNPLLPFPHHTEPI